MTGSERIPRMQILKHLSFIKSARWINPKKSKADPDCAIMEFDLELEPETVKGMSTLTALLKLFDARVDTDHPVFEYLGKQKNTNQVSRLILTVSIRPKD